MESSRDPSRPLPKLFPGRRFSEEKPQAGESPSTGCSPATTGERSPKDSTSDQTTPALEAQAPLAQESHPTARPDRTDFSRRKNAAESSDRERLRNATRAIQEIRAAVGSRSDLRIGGGESYVGNYYDESVPAECKTCRDAGFTWEYSKRVSPANGVEYEYVRRKPCSLCAAGVDFLNTMKRLEFEKLEAREKRRSQVMRGSGLKGGDQ